MSKLTITFCKAPKISIKRKFTQQLYTKVFIYRRTHTDSSKRK